jgi:iron complex transport system permease protein
MLMNERNWKIEQNMDPPSSLQCSYRQHVKGKFLLLLVLALLLVGLVILAMFAGAIAMSAGEVFGALMSRSSGGLSRIIWDVRLPRIVAALLAGSGLAVSGALMQSILRNPLASPYTLGLSSAAAFGASFAIIFLGSGVSTSVTVLISDPVTVTFFAFLFCLISTGAILLLTLLTTISAQSMVLAGIAIGSLFTAGLTLMQYLADSVQLSHIVSWTFGDLGRANWQALGGIAIVLAVVSVITYYYRWDLNAMDTGDESALSLGVNISRLRILGMVLASLLSAVLVSFFGTIAFVGLLGPHIARRLFGSDHRYLLFSSALIGAGVLLLADTVSRTIFLPMVLPVGILTSLLGGPVFIYLLVRGERS